MELSMSEKELDRALVLKNVQEGVISKMKDVTICEKPNGETILICNGKNLDYTIYGEVQYKPKFACGKDIDYMLDVHNFLLHRKIFNRGITKDD